MPRDVPVRIEFIYRGDIRKLLSFFTGRDNSFYFHPYRPSEAPWHTQLPRGETSPSSKQLEIDFTKFRPSSFAFDKISFHPSGFIHLKSLAGERYVDGIRGPQFSDLPLPYDFAVFVPCELTQLPLHTPGKYMDIQIELPDDVPPFYSTFSIVSTEGLPKTVQGPIIPHPLSFVFPQRDLAVALTLWPVRPSSAEPSWPECPFHIYRTGI
jgi:hypothetical protein